MTGLATARPTSSTTISTTRPATLAWSQPPLADQPLITDLASATAKPQIIRFPRTLIAARNCGGNRGWAAAPTPASPVRHETDASNDPTTQAGRPSGPVPRLGSAS